jgi:hypothetical protein
MATHEFTRQELYDLVWSIPMTKLAERYGISGNGLAKACRKAAIPVPERGYWAKLQAGKKATRKALPAAKRDTPRRVIISPPGKQEDPTPPPPVPESVAVKIEQAKQAAKPVSVPATLSNLHRIVAGWIEEQKRRSDGPRFSWTVPGLPMDDNDLGKRRLRIFSALLKAIEASGYALKCERYREVQIQSGAMVIELILEEHVKQIRRLITDEDRRSSRWYAEGQKWTQEKVPTGRLRLRLHEPEYRHVVKEWEETESDPLEAHLDEVLPKLAGAFEEIRLRRVRQAVEQARRAEAEHVRYEAELERKREAIRFRRLVAHCENRRVASDIRELIEAVERSALATENPEQFADWKRWALFHAERVDPLGKASLFDREVGSSELYRFER